jgi:hypothetical protein
MDAAARFKWKASVGDRVIGQGENIWPVGSPSAAPVTFEVSSAGELALDLEIEVGGERKRIRRTVTARESGLAATRQLSDEALTSDLTALDARMATTRDPKERAKVREAYESAESIAYERGLWEEPAEFEANWGVRRKYEDPETSQWKPAETRDSDRIAAEGRRHLPQKPGATWSPENRSPAAMQALQHHTDVWYRDTAGTKWETYVQAGASHDPQAARRLTQQYMAAGPGFAEARGRLDKQVGVGAEIDPRNGAGADAVHEQLGLSEGDAAAFRGTLRREAHRTAFDLVRDSERAIRGQLARYGLPDIPEDLTNLEGGFFGAAAPQLIVAQNAEKERPLGDRKNEQADQEQLAAAATELVQLQADIKALLTERKILTGQNGVFNPVAAAEHQALFGDLEKYPSVDADSSAVPDGATLPLIDSMLGEKRRQLKLRWVELEKQHPMLAAFRDGKGTPTGTLEGMTEKGGDQQQAMVAQVLPKLRNIAKVRGKLEEGEVKPLALPQVVAVARQRLLVPPGSMRDAVVREEVEASRGGDDHWAIMALTLGIAALTAVPTGGSSFLAAVKVAGELAMLGADLWQASETLDDYQTQKAATDTDLDQAKALSDENPPLAWLAIDLLALPLGGLGVKQSVHEARMTLQEARAVMRKARALRAAVEAGEDAKALREELNRLGKARGLPEGGELGTRIEREAKTGAQTTGVAGDAMSPEMLSELSTRLGAPVERAAIGSGVEVDFHITDGNVSVARVRVGPAASAADVLLHRETIRLAQRYNGTWGGLRKTLDDIKGLFGHDPTFRPGTPQWQAWLEGEKHLALSTSRTLALEEARGPAARSLLERELHDLEERRAQFEELSRQLNGPAAANVTVSAPNLAHWDEKFGFSDGLIADGTFEHATGAWAVSKSAKAPKVPKGLGREVERLKTMANLDADALGAKWISELKNKRRSADPKVLRESIREEANAVVAKELERLDARPEFQELLASSPDEARHLRSHVEHYANQAYFEKVEEGVRSHIDELEEVAREHGDVGDELKFAGLVDEAVAVRPIGGKLPINHDFAGRYKPLDALDPAARKLVEKEGLPGVAYTRNGQPDFTPWIHQEAGVPCDVDLDALGGLTGDRALDERKALAWLREKHPELRNWRPTKGLTWHHHEGGRLILVPTPLHDSARHTGAVSAFKAHSGNPNLYRGEE